MRRQWIAAGLLGALLAGTGALTACGDADSRVTVDNGAGVTRTPCPTAVDRAKGCVYLGTIADLGTAQTAAAVEAQKRFWDRVNRAGGIGGYEVDTTRYVRDNRGSVPAHVKAYRQIRGKVLALAHTTGSATTAAILADLRTDRTVAAPASWTSAWAFEPGIVESGASYCVEAINAVDHARSAGTVRSVMAVHLPGDYGDDGAAGVKAAAAATGLTFINIKTDPGAGRQEGAVGQILARQPDLVMLHTNPAETEVIVREATAGGYRGRFIGAGPSWDPALLRSPGAQALRERYLRSAPWGPWSSDTPGHAAMRSSLGDASALGPVEPNEGHVAGWIWSYPLKAALESAAGRGDVSRSGLVAAVEGLRSVDYEGMLPADVPGRQSMILSPATGTGVRDEPVVRDFFAAPAAALPLIHPCFQDL
jgi:ABC-type branched-subunit amino acid transport system substrate-binding protein